MWGIPEVLRQLIYRKRFIPTRVGNTCSSGFLISAITVHPHACGEYFECQSQSLRGGGSSPRVWGILLGKVDAREIARFIPTRVGNTSIVTTGRVLNAVHPHACGEYPQALSLRSLQGGSSPRVWGIHFFHLVELPKVINVSGFYRNFPSTNLNSICAIPSF